MKRLVLCAVVVFAAGVAQGQSPLTIDSDTTIDYAIDWMTYPEIIDGASPPTVVNVVEPASTYNIVVRDSSILNVFGGEIHAYTGVSIGFGIYADGTSTVNVFGGYVEGLAMSGSSTASIYGGEVDWAIASANGTLSIYGGEVDSALAIPNGTLSVFGGSVAELVTWGDAIITVYGSDFSYPYGPIAESEGTLTGTLRNGDPIQADFRNRDDGSIILAIPEPSTLILLLIALSFATVCWWRRRQFS